MWRALVFCVGAAIVWSLWPRPPSVEHVSAPATQAHAAAPPRALELSAVTAASLPASGFCPAPNEKLLGYIRPGFESVGDANARAALREYVHARSVSEGRRALERAYDLARGEPAIALAYAHSVLHTQHSDRARAALATYLAAHPRDIQNARLYARLNVQHDVERDHQVITRDGFTLRAPPRMQAAHALLDAIVADVREAAALTDTEARRELLITVYRDRSELLAVTCTPAWAGGIYDGTLRLVAEARADLGVDEEAMRHEALHAQLGPLLPPQPLWFHEGLAQYFAARGGFRFSRAHRLMRDNRTYIPFRSLEGSFFVFDGNSEAALAYEQSVAMVHMLVDKLGPSVIPRAVALLREDPRRGDLIATLAAPATIDEHTLLDWLER